MSENNSFMDKEKDVHYYVFLDGQINCAISQKFFHSEVPHIWNDVSTYLSFNWDITNNSTS